MTNLLVHVPAIGRAAPQQLDLRPGQVARFGRGAPGHPVDVLLEDPAVPRLAGEIHAFEDYWRLSNFSTSRTLLVENPEGAGEYLRVRPRRLGAPVPFEFSRVVLPTKCAPVSFQVFAPDHSYFGPEQRPELLGTATLAPFSMDEGAIYFAVLLALCEPRLRDVSTVAIPTTAQVVERLSEHDACRDLTEQAAAFQIDYLARNKLRVKQPGSRLDWKREAVVSAALRYGLVSEEHLDLLPSRRQSLTSSV